MDTFRASLARGFGFGLAAALVDFVLRAMTAFAQRIVGAYSVRVQIALELIALGGVIGLAGWPLLRFVSPARIAAIAHVAWITGAWLALEIWLAVDSPSLSRGMYARPLVAGAALLAILELSRVRERFAPLAASVAAALLALAIVAPNVYLTATAKPAPPNAALPPAPAGAPDVVLIVLDTVRAENLSAYGYARKTSPTFDALAAEGALFLDATSPATWSLPAHSSLFTARWPSSHGAQNFGVQLDDRFPTLAQVLAANGYDTACFTANSWINDAIGLTRGFAYQDLSWQSKTGNGGLNVPLRDVLGLGAQDKGGASVAGNFEAWARTRPKDARPSFAFLNFVEAHFPHHQLPAEYRDRFSAAPLAAKRAASRAVLSQQFGGSDPDLARDGPIVRDLYDGGVAYTDYLLGRIVDALRERGTLDRTVLIVLADHGEILGEHGGFFGHGPSLYQRAIRVPLLVRYPAAIPAGARVAIPVSTMSAFATVMELTHLAPPPTLQAPSLAPLANGGTVDPAAYTVLAEATSSPNRNVERADPQMAPGDDLRAIRSGAWKLVTTSSGRSLLYDLASDPHEARDLAEAEPAQLAALAAELEAARVRFDLPPISEVNTNAGKPAQLDEATRQQLEALGYVDDSAEQPPAPR